MNLQVIKTERDYQKAIKRLELIFDAKKGSKEGDELELLSLLIDNYEKENQLEDFRDSNS
jgi:HTH-type transcriptional regulator/antitoxin HigA